MISSTCYKIRRADGQFSRGGYCPNFAMKGKAWPSLRALNLHLAGVGRRADKVYAMCEVVTVIVETREEGAVSVADYVAGKERSRRERAEKEAMAREAAKAIREEEDERRTYERLKKKFDVLSS